MKKIILKGKTYEVDGSEDAEPMMQQLVAQGAEIVAACGGAGICQTCAFKPIHGHFTEKTETETLMDLPDGQRLSCQCKPKTDGEIEILF
jgi:ferredoxin